MRVVLLCGIVFTIIHISASQVIGKSCKDRYTNQTGVCKLSKDCPAVEKKIKDGVHPTICGYQRHTSPIVCCEEIEVNPLVITDLEDSPLVFDEDNIRPQSVSERKCEAFTNLTTDFIKVLALVARPSPRTFNITRCEHNGVPLVVGGKPASAGEFPFMAALGYQDGQFRCGGTLISENFVITAAHCVRSRHKEPVRVRLGTLSLDKPDDYSKPVDIEIDAAIVHPDFKPNKKYNDIALLRLKRNAEFNKYVRPACLYTKHEVDSPKAIATGWGTTSFGGTSSHDALQKVTLDIFSNSRCNSVFRADSRIPEGIINSMLCSGVLEGGRDTCQGDSGGPLLVTRKDNNCVFFIIGITSFGKFCAQENTPAVYTRVSEYLPWIERNVWPDN